MERKDALLGKNLLFWLSRQIDYPLLPPDFVQVNFTFKCNLRCKMCDMQKQMEINKKENKQVEIDTALCMKIIEDTKELGTKSIIFLGGEPFVREDLFELVAYARSFHLETILVTNGVLLNDENIKKCFETGVHWLSVSLDAASEKVFSQIRGRGVFQTVVDNMRNLNRLKKQENREFPKVAVVCTVMNDNLEELTQVVNLSKELEVNKVLFQPVVACNVNQVQREDEFPGSIPKERLEVLDEVISELIKYKKSTPLNYSFLANSVKRLELMKKYFREGIDRCEVPCYAGYNRLQIIQEGKVYFCVNRNESEAIFGDIRKESLKKLWYSKRADQYRKMIRQCPTPCLQLCSQREEFIELVEYSEKKDLFGEI
ncbi:MAG: radical SAM protein [Candidatus Omnitrophota bacterium]